MYNDNYTERMKYLNTGIYTSNEQTAYHEFFFPESLKNCVFVTHNYYFHTKSSQITTFLV